MPKEIEELTEPQQAALDRLVEAFGIRHGKLAVEVKVVAGVWEEAVVNPQRRVLRKCQTRVRG
ncbi:MAG: hypothetical protein ACYC2Y_10570 [Armatimonadota bacterium]